MVRIPTKNERSIDFSFMPSLRCNLSCSHCMYEASPQSSEVLDITKAEKFFSTIGLDKINAFGFYGGEISCDYDQYQRVIDITPENIARFTITNGTWSRNEQDTRNFVEFAERNKLVVFVSTSRFHRPFQNKKRLEETGFILKGEDHIIPMGRSRKDKYECSRKCTNYDGPMRLTMKPSGDIIFCNCDGIYPIVGTYEERFDEVLEKAIEISKHPC